MSMQTWCGGACLFEAHCQRTGSREATTHPCEWHLCDGHGITVHAASCRRQMMKLGHSF